MRLSVLAIALLTVPIIAGLRTRWGLPIDGTAIIATSILIVVLVIGRIGLLVRQLHRT